MKRFCLGCMNEKSTEELCPICGYAEGTKAKEAYHIVPGTILKKKYLVGKVARDLSRIFFSEKEIRGSRLKNIKIPTVRRPTSWRNDCGIFEHSLYRCTANVLQYDLHKLD